MGTPVSFELTSSGVMNSFFVPQLGGQIYTMAGMVTRLHLQADHTGTYRGMSANYSGAGFSDMYFNVDAVPAERFAQWVAATRTTGPVLDAQAYADLAKPSQAVAPFTYRAVAPEPVQRHPERRNAAGRSIAASPIQSHRGQKNESPWQAQLGARSRSTSRSSWARRPRMVLGIVFVLGWVTLKGYVPYLWREWITSVDHKRIGVMYIVLALLMLLRGFSDAIMMRAQQAVAAGGAQGYLPPEHFDQIFSAHGTIMIFFVAMPLVIGLMNFAVPLQLGIRDVAFPTLNSVSLVAHRVGHPLDQHLAGGRRVRENRLGRLSAAQRAAVLARRRRRLLPLGAADLRHRHVADGNKFRHHDPENAGTRNGLHAHAGLLLDGARLEPAHCRGFSGPDRDVRDAAARPLPRLPLLFGRRRRQPDDVREPVLGVGSPRGLHPRPAGVRHLLGGERDLLRQAAVRLPLDGRCDHGDLRSLLHWSGCTTSSPWGPAQTSMPSSASRA